MIRIAIVEKGRLLSIENLTSPEQLRSAIELARKLIAECEQRLSPVSPSGPGKPRQGVPYLS
jgi:hypothetical protein